MSLRYCVYKDCHNYFNLSDRSYSKENITFFQFPKDPQRRQKWLQLGKAQPNLAGSFYFYCSDHFDRKYKSERHRRTSLVGEAVPYAYESVSINDQTETANSERCVKDELPSEYYMYEEMGDDLNCETRIEQQQDQDLQVESTTMIDDDIIQLVRSAIDSDDDHLEQNEKPLCVTQTLNKCAYKRKSPSAITPASSSSSNAKILKTITVSLPSSNGSAVLKNVSLLPLADDNAKCRRPGPTVDIVDRNIKGSFVINNQKTISHPEEVPFEAVAMEDEDIDLESLVDSKHATTFIFKGKEYVQMPKDYYINEKIELLKKIQKMESVIENIKKELNM